MEAWNVYLSILLSNNPGRALELVGYPHLICLANKLLPLNAWLQYDSKFHTMAASNPHLCWDQHHPDLWLEALALSNLGLALLQSYHSLSKKLSPFAFS